MPTKTVEAAINDQIAKEFFASHLYLSMVAWFEDQNLPGFAQWMRIQTEEERGHAMRLFNYLIEAGGRVRLKAIEAPAVEFTSPLQVMQESLKHEQKVTASIRKLYELADKEKDYGTQLHLQWFISEQQEEEKNVSDVIARLKLAGDNKVALLLIDRELGGRGPEDEGEGDEE
jgi:ferritin